MASYSSCSDILPSLSRTFKAREYYPSSASDQRKRKRFHNSDTSFEVRKSRVGDGIGMFATRPIKCGDLIIAHEVPIVSISAEESSNFCQVCAAPTGSLLRNHITANHHPDLSSYDDLVFTTEHRSCQKCNRITWCSNGCGESGERVHALLCGKKNIEAQELHHFLRQQKNTIIFQLATKAILLALCEIQKLPKQEQISVKQLLWWNDYGSHPQWYTLGSCQKIKEERASQIKQLSVTIQKALKNYKDFDKEIIEQICSVKNVGSLLGMLQSNAMEFEYPSPNQQYTEQMIDQPTSDGEELASNSSDIPPMVGSGLYPLLTLANHDCNPNASIEFLQESNRGSMVALRDIAKDEEICITYVPNGGWGNSDDAAFFRHFEPTRTWKWLNRNAMEEEDNDGEEDSDEADTCVDGLSSEHDEEPDEKDEDSGAKGSESSFNNKDSLEGSSHRERAKALMDYGFHCHCKRCLDERKYQSSTEPDM